MKVLILSTFGQHGGAAIASYRLYKALKSRHVNVSYLVMLKKSNDSEIMSIDDTLIGKSKAWLSFIKERLFFLPYEKKKEYRYKFSPAKSGVSVTDHPLIHEADIIHIHWTQFGFLSLENIKAILALGKKVIFTMHDMWLITGGCHYSYECTNYKDSCGNCFYLKNSGPKDLSYIINHRKKDVFSSGKFEVTSCSNWLADLAGSSGLLKNKSIKVIPNAINTEIFKPLDKKLLRKSKGLETNKKAILFGAFDLNDPRKGFHLLIKALKKWEPEDKVYLLLLGKSENKVELNLHHNFEVKHLGYLKSEESIAKAYNLADVFVLPTLYDNLPMTIMESLSCGTPAVSFNIGGLSDLIAHKENGYLAKPENTSDLLEGLKYVLSQNTYNLSKNARKYALDYYSYNKVATNFLNLYTYKSNK